MNKKGFTLTELVVYVGILGLVVSFFAGFAANLIKSDRLFAHRIRVAEEMDFIMRTITDTVRTAESLNNAGSNPPLSVFGRNGGNGQCNNGQLSRLGFKKNGSSSNWFEVINNAYGSDANNNRQNGLIFNSSVGGQVILTSPRVAVCAFRVDCVGPVPCNTNPKSVRLTIQLMDLTSREVMTATSTVTPRGFD
ncbi:MAG: hypothetical protein EXS68_01450 [Candidatus Ryanbacteria bacterium]|nr:hypothetical protein [Candidatus Ryanbacteria bacterium]